MVCDPRDVLQCDIFYLKEASEHISDFDIVKFRVLEVQNGKTSNPISYIDDAQKVTKLNKNRLFSSFRTLIPL